MSKFPGVIKIDTGETLFAEIFEDNNVHFLTVRIPYSIAILKNQIQLFRWNPFSDDETYKIPRAKVVNVATMDDTHKKIYATVVLAKNADNIKTLVDNEIKCNVNDLGNKLSKLFDELVYSTAEIGIAYNVPIPEVNDLKDSFYSYVITKFDTSEEIPT